MGVKVTNNAFGTISAGINTSATTVTVDSGQGARFPTLGSGDYFYATLIDTSNNLEVIKVTARSTDSMTVTRAQDNTTARAFAIGDRIELRPTAALFTDTANIDLNVPAQSSHSGKFLTTDGTNVSWGDAGNFAGLTDTTVATSDPTATTNPPASGHFYVNKSSGEVFVCTSATTDDNVWMNVGEGTGNVRKVLAVEVMLVAGGGGGGEDNGGGGGGGAVATTSSNINYSFGTSTSVTIGAGGAGGTGGDQGGRHGGFSAVGSGLNSLTAYGGGGGMTSFSSSSYGSNHGSYGQDQANGGGGAGVNDGAGGAGTGRPGLAHTLSGADVFDGFNGGNGSANQGQPFASGGGAGAAANGGNFSGSSYGAGNASAGAGGSGKQVNIDGNNKYYSGGGGGGVFNTSTAGNGGLGGGGGGSGESGGTQGTGGGSAVNTGGNGTANGSGGAGGANTGGGGGGTRRGVSPGGNGGSVIIIIKYAGAQKATGGTVTTVSGSTVHTFTSSGTFAYT